ncbi:MAG: WG repeat-containing protein [Oscillospiraceae bacterium]|nr:WG repeat-containing protein [Oscillospiraceae bacterium]
MKRICAFLLCLALLLAGCGPAPGAETTAASTAAPAEPTSPPPAEPPAETELFSGSVTAGGVRVHTDPSAYSPYAGPGAVYTRLAEGVLDRFTPSPDYGAVYPYAAAKIVQDTEQGESWTAGYFWGLMDKSGRILTDGLYSRVRPLSSYSEQIDMPERFHPYWLVTQVTKVETFRNEEGEEWRYGIPRYGLVAMDGSFALDCVYTRIIGLEQGFACAVEEKAGFTVYDAAGTPLFETADLGQDTDADWWQLDYGEGLYCYTTEKETELGQYHSQCCYYDDAGKRVLGPYARGGPFRDGLACVSSDGTRYGFIDRSGAWVIEPRLQIQSVFQNGRTINSTDRGEVVLDSQGKERIAAPKEGWLSQVPCGFCLYSGEGGGVGRQYYDPDGNLLISGDGSWECVDADLFYQRSWDSAYALLLQRSTGRELKLPPLDRIQRGVSLRNGELSLGYVGWSYSKNLRCFIPEDLSGVQSAKNPPHPWNAGMSDQTLTDPCTGERWHLCWTGSAWEGLSESGKALRVPVDSGEIQILGNLVCVITDRACLYLDLEGKTVFSYPLEDGD